MPRPSAPSKIFERNQKILDVFKIFWTCPKNLNAVQKYLKWKEFEEKDVFKIFEHGQKIFEYVKIFQHIQNFLNGADGQGISLVVYFLLSSKSIKHHSDRLSHLEHIIRFFFFGINFKAI